MGKHQVEHTVNIHYSLCSCLSIFITHSWMAAEKACNLALSQHRSGKGYWRRAKARRMLGRMSEAMKGSCRRLMRPSRLKGTCSRSIC